MHASEHSAGVVKDASDHSTIREGLAVGLLGAIVLAVWYVASDAIDGHFLHTPDVLGRMLVAGAAGHTAGILPGAVAGYAVLHVAVFLLIGVLMAWAIHAANRYPTVRTGVVIAVVLGLGYVYSILLSTPSFAGDSSLRWSVMVGVLVAFIAMALYLWRRHPSLRRQVHEVEAPGPPHPPGAQAG